MTLEDTITPRTQRSEAQKRWINSTQEYYHPTKYEPQQASLAQVMRSISPLCSGSVRSGLVRSSPLGDKWDATRRVSPG